jgi:uncharacterized RDD family membrane protein YckC
MNYKNRIERLSGDDIILAPIKKRLAAFLIDCLVIFLLYIFVLVIFSLFNINDWNINVASIFDVDIETNIHNPYFIFLLKALFGLLPVIYFTTSLYISKGRTIGKYLFRIKVVSLFHERLGLWHCFERSLGYFTSALESGFGFIQARWNPNSMALHDKIGETIVICIPSRRIK